MKAGVAMLVSAFVRAKREDVQLPGDLVLVVLSDEEAGGNLGARYLVEEHPELFEGMRYGARRVRRLHPRTSGGKRFYPIQVAEKQICWLKATIRGPGGHGAMINRGGTVARLARFLTDLDRKRLPVHVTPVVRETVERIAAELPRHQAVILRSLLKPRLTDQALAPARSRRPAQFEPMLRNTVNATIVRGGAKINVVPSEIELELDGRALPGFSPEQLIAELHDLAGDDIELEVVRHDPGAAAPDLGLFDTLAEVIRELDPEGIPFRCSRSESPTAASSRRPGVQTYGFLPMRLPRGLRLREADPRRRRADPGRRGRVRSRGCLARRAEVPLKILDPRRDEVPRAGDRRGRARARARADPLQPRRDRPRAVSGGGAAPRRPEARPLRARRAHLGRRDRHVRLCAGRRPRSPPSCCARAAATSSSRASRPTPTSPPARPRRARSRSSNGLPVDELASDYSNYGPLKALCEAEVERVFGERALIVRPGLIVGPHDPTGRFTYWARRLERGGEILAPGPQDRHAQFVDVRDLATWILDAVEGGLSGIFNATNEGVPWGELLAGAKVTWVSDEFLREHEVGRVDGAAALARGPRVEGACARSTSAEPSPRACASGRSRRRSPEPPPRRPSRASV